MINPVAAIRNYKPSAMVRAFIISLTVPLALLFVYFSFHVTSRTRYFNDRNFRQLSNLSDEVSGRVADLGTAFTNAVDRFLNPPPDQQPLKENGGFQSYLDVLRSDGAIFSAGHIKPQDAAGKKTDFTVNIDVTMLDSTPWLSFEGNGKLKDGSQLNVSAGTDFRSLIESILSRQEEAQSKTDSEPDFDHVVVARADTGETLFEQTTQELHLTSFEYVHLADTPDKTFDLKTRSQTTDSVDVTIAGTRYKLYVQPIEIALPTKGVAGGETHWVICGLVDASRFRYQTWTISYTVLIPSFFVAGLLLLSWFFLKLLFIGPKDRLRPVETHVLAISVIVAGFLLTGLVIYSLTYTNLELILDKQLENVADTFKTNFRQEVELALDQIDKLDLERVERIHRPAEYVTRTNLLKEICKDGNCDSKQTPYPYFKSVLWIDDQGQQIAKWTINSQTTKFINVGTRKYFTNIRNGYPLDLNGRKFWLEHVVSKITGGFTTAISKAARAEGEPKASVVVLDTNLVSLMKPAMVRGFSYRIIDADGEVVFPNIKENFFKESDQDRQLRSAVSGHLSDWVNAPYLGRDSRIYVTPIPGMPDWTLAVFRDKEPLRSGYLELVTLSSLLFVIYLLVFLSLLMVMFLAFPATRPARKWLWPSPKSSPIYLQSIPATVLLCFVAYWLSTRLSDRALVVVFSSLSLVAILLLTVQLKYRFELRKAAEFADALGRLWSKINYRFLFILCLVPLVFLLAVLPSLAFFRLAFNQEMDLFTKYGQITLVNSLNEREARVRSAYAGIDFGSDPKAAQNFVQARLNQVFDRCDDFFFDTQVANGRITTTTAVEPHELFLLGSLRKLLPFGSRSSIIRHGLVESKRADNFWRWGRNEGGKLVLQAGPESPSDGTDKPANADKTDTTNTAGFSIISNTPHFWLRRLSWFSFVSLMVFILFLVIRFVVKRVFLLDAVKLVSNSEDKQSVLSGTWKRFVVLGSPYTRRNQLAPKAEFKVLNLAVDKWGQKFDLEEFLKDTPSRSIAIECFEYEFDQPQQNLQKLTLLEDLLTHDGTVLVSSTADPSDYHFEIPDNAVNDLRITDASARWAGLMSKFWIQYLEDDGNIEAFKNELRENHKNKNRTAVNGNQAASKKSEVEQCKTEAVKTDTESQNGTGAKPDEPIATDPAEEKLYQLLIRECAPRACLQDIGKAIAKRWNFKNTCPEALIEEVLLQATTYYKFVWKSCSRHEKVTLAHLARDGFVSPNDPDLQQLVRRGFIVRDPEVRLMNESFRLFVIDKCRTDEDVAVTEGEARKSSSWQYLKIALYVAVVVVMVFLFATQRDLYNTTLVALTSILGGLPVILNFFNLFQKNAAAPRPPSPSS
ncbi:MAG TPA: cache domain-containing protein [Pyrinomonadaceae bacterium]|nr:cache domain-containing protein [Pyrinomonadaceae bacterium]